MNDAAPEPDRGWEMIRGCDRLIGVLKALYLKAKWEDENYFGSGWPLHGVREAQRRAKWKQERPSWCPHSDCGFRMRVQDAICGGYLPKPEPHLDDFNDMRLCFNADGGPFDLQVNKSDLYHIGRVLAVLKQAEDSDADG